MARAAFSRYGGKFYLLPTILPLLPPHECWLELFCGASWVTLAKPPAPIETINDLDEGVAGFYRVLRDPEQSRRLQELLDLTPYSRTEFLTCRASWQDCTDPVERARRWFVVARQAVVGRTNRTGWSYSSDVAGSGPQTTNRWWSAIAYLPEVHERLKYVQIDCRDWRPVLAFWDRPETLAYIDPPYVLSTRSGGKGYLHEMEDSDHRDLITALLEFRGRAVVSGYAHPIYEALDDAGWQRIDVPIVAHSTGSTRQGGGKQQRVESIWLNYDPAVERGQMRLEVAT